MPLVPMRCGLDMIPGNLASVLFLQSDQWFYDLPNNLLRNSFSAWWATVSFWCMLLRNLNDWVSIWTYKSYITFNIGFALGKLQCWFFFPLKFIYICLHDNFYFTRIYHSPKILNKINSYCNSPCVRKAILWLWVNCAEVASQFYPKISQFTRKKIYQSK